MISITPQAGALLSAELSREETTEGVAFKFLDAGNGKIAIERSAPAEGDLTLEHDGKAVLAVPPTLADRLGDVVVDVTETQEGVALALRANSA